MAIATSSIKESFDIKMKYHEKMVGYMDVICTGNMVENGKPAPDIFLLAAKKLKLDPKKCIVFEDSPNGVLAAKAAGCYCVALPDSRLPGTFDRVKEGKADIILKSLKEFDYDLF